MRACGWAFWSILLWGCGSTPFLIANFDSDHRPKLKTVAIMPFSQPLQNSLAEKYGLSLEGLVCEALIRADSAGTFVAPLSVRRRLAGAADSLILKMPAESLGNRVSAEGLLYTRVVRLYEAAGSNPTSREIGAGRFQRRGVELLLEFRLVEASSGKLLWKYRVLRVGEDVPTAGQRVGQAVAEAWPRRS